jgi:hypothetical protein
VVVDGKGRPLNFTVTGGQVHDSQVVEEVLNTHPEPSQRDQTGLLSEALLSAAAQNRKLSSVVSRIGGASPPLRQTRSKLPCRHDPHRRLYWIKL